MAFRAAMGSQKTRAIDARGRGSDCRVVPAKHPNKGLKEADARIMVDLNGHEGGNAGDSQAKPEEPSGGRRRSAEGVEGRRQAEGNAVSQSTLRTQSRVGVSTARDRIRQAAKTDKGRRFTTLLHHVYDIGTLREAYDGGGTGRSPLGGCSSPSRTDGSGHSGSPRSRTSWSSVPS